MARGVSIFPSYAHYFSYGMSTLFSFTGCRRHGHRPWTRRIASLPEDGSSPRAPPLKGLLRRQGQRERSVCPVTALHGDKLRQRAARALRATVADGRRRTRLAVAGYGGLLALLVEAAPERPRVVPPGARAHAGPTAHITCVAPCFRRHTEGVGSGLAMGRQRGRGCGASSLDAT